MKKVAASRKSFLPPLARGGESPLHDSSYFFPFKRQEKKTCVPAAVVLAYTRYNAYDNYGIANFMPFFAGSDGGYAFHSDCGCPLA